MCLWSVCAWRAKPSLGRRSCSASHDLHDGALPLFSAVAHSNRTGGAIVSRGPTHCSNRLLFCVRACADPVVYSAVQSISP